MYSASTRLISPSSWASYGSVTSTVRIRWDIGRKLSGGDGGGEGIDDRDAGGGTRRGGPGVWTGENESGRTGGWGGGMRRGGAASGGGSIASGIGCIASGGGGGASGGGWCACGGGRIGFGVGGWCGGVGGL